MNLSRSAHAGLAFVALSQLIGCASIVNGQSQSVSVETRSASGAVTGANCKLSNNKGSWFITSPGSTTVQRSFEDLSVRCERDGFEPGLASVKSSTKAMAFGNILFGGIIGAGVDISTGAAYDYPTVIAVEMGKSTVIAPPAAAASAAASASSPTSVPPSGPAPAPTSATTDRAPAAPAAATPVSAAK